LCGTANLGRRFHENFFGSMKTELDDNVAFETRHEAKAAVFGFHRGLS
jgi:hypothetical protein